MAMTALAMTGALLLGGAGAVFSHDSVSPFEIEIEGGPVWQTRNDVRIPNDASGTKFSLVEVLGSGPYAAGRAYITWNASERHSCRILLAPLSITGTGALASPVDFAGESFKAGVPTETTYRFNSWRATYRYRLRNGERAAWWIGFTAKVRDAKIQLDQAGVTARKTDVGFVPLLHIGGLYRWRGRWHVVLDLDALAGGPGRAEDVALEFRYDAGGRWRLSGGYRTVEGGADVDAVYAFAWLHYIVLSAEMGF
jgi:hypothetical protein